MTKIAQLRILVVLAVLAVPAVAQAQYTYMTNPDNTITITHYSGSDGAVFIPSTINGLPVSSLGSGVFAGNASLTSVTIPNGVTNIANTAFYNCTSLASVAIPSNVISIGNNVFYNCTSLTSVTIPNSVTSIGSFVFENCSSLTHVTIPNSITNNLGSGLFEYCTSLTRVTIPSGVTTIKSNLFYGCASLTNVTMPANLTLIKSYAFYNCTNLPSVTIPNGVTNISDYAFSSCASLTNIYFQGNAPTLGSNVFNPDPATVYYLSGTTGWGSIFGGLPATTWQSPGFQYTANNGTITIMGYIGTGGSVSIPSTINGLPITSIGCGAFSNCAGVTSVTIPNSVTNIGTEAFYGCVSLSSIYFQGNAPTLGLQVFHGDSVTIYYLSGTTGWGATFGGEPTQEEITLDDGVNNLAQFLQPAWPPASNVLAQAQQDFAFVCMNQPSNYAGRVYAAATLILGMTTNAALQQVLANYGLDIGTMLQSKHPTSGFDVNSTQTVDQALNQVSAQLLPALNAAYADLSAMPTNWPGSFVIPCASFTNFMDEDVWIDLGDVQALKGMLKVASAFINLAEGYTLDVNYAILANDSQAPTPDAPIVVDGRANDWAGVAPNLVGGPNDPLASVTAAKHGTNVYVLAQFANSNVAFLSLELIIDGQTVYCNSGQGEGCSVWIAGASTLLAASCVWTNTCCEIGFAWPFGTPTNDAVSYSGVVLKNGYSWYNYFPRKNVPVVSMLTNHPAFLSSVRNPGARATARTNLLDAIDAELQTYSLVGNRADGQLHLVNIDPSDLAAANQRVSLQTYLTQLQASLNAPTGFEFVDDQGRDILQMVFLGALFGATSDPFTTPPSVAPRSLLPPMNGPIMHPSILGDFPDPTFGGVLPGMDRATLTNYLQGQNSYTPVTAPLTNFARWASSNGLSGDLTTLFEQRATGGSLPYGFQYIFGQNLAANKGSALNLIFVDGHPVADVLAQDLTTTNDATLALSASTNLTGNSWSIPLEPESDTTRKPGYRNWYRLQGGMSPGQAYFRLQASRKP